MLNLDTHILIFALAGTLRPRERALLLESNWAISGIVLWEFAMLEKRKRISLSLSDKRVDRTLSQLTVLPIDVGVASALSRLDFEADPADEIIAATSVSRGIPLLTRDRRLLGSKVVPLARGHR